MMKPILSSLRFGPAAATLVIAASAVCFGLVPIFVRELQGLGTGPATIALYRYGFSVLFLLPFLPLAKHKRGGALLMAGAGCVLGLSLIGYLEALQTVPVATAGVVYMTYPVFAALFAYLLLRQTLTWRSHAAAGLVVAAASLLLDPVSLSPKVFQALLWAIPAPVAFGFLVVVLSGLAGALTAAERTVCGLGGAVIGLLPLAIHEGRGSVLPSTGAEWGLIVTMGLTTALVPQMLFSIACQKVGPMRTAAAGSFELPTMFMVGWLIFGEAIGLREIASAVLVISAILVAPAVGASPRGCRRIESPA